MAETKNVVVSVLCFVISLISIVGNVLVCHVILRVKSMRTAMNYLLLNLALLDSITGILAIPNVVLNDRSGVFETPVFQQIHNQSAIAAEVLCKIEACFWFGSSVTPVLLMVIAYERYKAVVHPLTRRDSEVTKDRLKWLLPLTWLWGLGFLITDMILISYNSKGMCDLTNFTGVKYKLYVMVYITTAYILPCVVITILYSRVIYSLRKNKAPGVQAEIQRKRTKARKRIIIVIIIVSATFYIFCGIPHILYFLDTIFGISFWLTFGNFPILLISINSASNPFIYFIFIASFRNGLKTVCKSTRQQRDNSSINAATIEAGSINMMSM